MLWESLQFLPSKGHVPSTGESIDLKYFKYEVHKFVEWVSIFIENLVCKKIDSFMRFLNIS